MHEIRNGLYLVSFLVLLRMIFLKERFLLRQVDKETTVVTPYVSRILSFTRFLGISLNATGHLMHEECSGLEHSAAF